MIIKVLIAAVLLMVIFLTFRMLFGADTPVSTAAPTLDTAQLEKTLQKILEAQAKAPVLAVPVEVKSSAGDTAVAVDHTAEVEKLKRDLVEKEKVIMQVRQEAAREAAKAAATAASANAAASGSVPESAAKFETKIKDLEARLAEYEIISEDIADLSFYKEENIRLQNELTSQKAGGAVSLVTPEIAGNPLAVFPQAIESGTVTTMGAPAPTMVTNLAADPEPAAGVSPADEDLMKEFEKAVQDQKAPQVPAKEAATDAAENSQLMNQFENFVKKS